MCAGVWASVAKNQRGERGRETEKESKRERDREGGKEGDMVALSFRWEQQKAAEDCGSFFKAKAGLQLNIVTFLF